MGGGETFKICLQSDFDLHFFFFFLGGGELPPTTCVDKTLIITTDTSVVPSLVPRLLLPHSRSTERVQEMHHLNSLAESW